MMLPVSDEYVQTPILDDADTLTIFSATLENLISFGITTFVIVVTPLIVVLLRFV